MDFFRYNSPASGRVCYSAAGRPNANQKKQAKKHITVRQEAPFPNQRRAPSRGVVSRAASALMFAAAAVALLVFPDGEAELSASVGFVPSQARNPDNITREQYRSINFSAQLCQDLGGDLENNRRVCSNIDINDTFCLIAAGDALPCEGLFRHVNLCNTAYNRPALDPFHCAQACADAPSGDRRKALGRECKKEVPADRAAPVRTADYLAAEGFQGAAHTIVVSGGNTVSFSKTKFGRYALNPVAASDDWEIEITRPIAQDAVVATAVAKIACAGCYPDPLSFTVSFNPLARPAQTPVSIFLARNESLNGASITLTAPNAPGNFALVSVEQNEIAYAPRPGELEIDPVAGTLFGTLAAAGDYVVWAEYASTLGRDSAEFFLGPMTLSLAIFIVPEHKVSPNFDQILPDRTPTVFAAENHAGAVYALTPQGAYALAYQELKSPGVTFHAASETFFIPAENPLGGDIRSATLTANLKAEPCPGSVDCAGDPPVTVTLFIVPVAAPPQDPLRSEYGDDFAHALKLPDDHRENPVLTILGTDPNENAFALSVSHPTVLIRNPEADPPGAGSHRVTVGMSHANFAGTLRLVVAAQIDPAALSASEWGLRPGDDSADVIVAAGYDGEIHRAESRNGRAEIFAPDPAPSGLRAVGQNQNSVVVFALDPPLRAGTFNATAVLTVRAPGGNHSDLPLPATLAASVVVAPAQAQAAAFAENPFSGPALVAPDFAGHPRLSDGNFAYLAPLDDAFEIDSDGNITGTPAADAVGVSTLTAGWTAAGMLGTLRVSLLMNVRPGRVVVADEVVAVRITTVAAAEGFVGAGWTVSVSDGYALRFPPDAIYDGHALNAVADGADWEVALTAPLGDAPRPAAATAAVVCESPDCRPNQPLTVTAVFNPVSDPGQKILTAFYDENFDHPPRIPSGYETGGEFVLRGVNGLSAAALESVSLRADAAAGTLSFRAAGGLIPAGRFTATIAMTHPDFLGTLSLETELAILPAPPGAAYEIPPAQLNPPLIAAAAGASVIVHRVRLGENAAGGTLLLPAESPAGLSLILSDDARTVAFQLHPPIAGGTTLDVVAALTVATADPNYGELAQAARLQVSALAAPRTRDADGRASASEPFVSDNVYDFGTGPYDGAVFGKRSGDARITVGADGVVAVPAPGISETGIFNVALTATSAAFAGTAEFELMLDIRDLSALPGTYAIPPSVRRRERIIAGAYAGSVAFYAAATVGVTLRTPAAAPEGFALPLNAEFVSPEGFAVSLVAPPPPGGVAVARFAVTATHLEFDEDVISLALTIRALAPPPPPVVPPRPAPFFDENIFDFAASDYQGGVYKNAAFAELAGGFESAGLNVTPAGVVETAATLTLAGVYAITVAAESEADFAGAATLALSLTVRWKIDYEVNSGAGGLAARPAGAADDSPSGFLSAPGQTVNFTATPSDTHYVSEWLGDCDSGAATTPLTLEFGDPNAPGEARACSLRADANLTVGVVFAPAWVPVGLGILNQNRNTVVVVAPDHTGSVAFFAAATVGVTLQTPSAAPESFGFPLGLDFESPEGFEVSLTLAAGSENATVAAIDATAKYRDYAATTIPLRVEIRALAAPALSVFTGAEGGDEVASGATVASFSLASHADAKFYEDADSGDLFEVSEGGAVWISAGDLPAGSYDFAAAATSAMFLGAVRFPLRVVVLGEISEALAVPPDRREILQLAVANYAGSVAFFAAAAEGATLRTPSAAPEGFDFPTGRDFVSPDGITVMAATALAAGGMTIGAFEVTAKAAGFLDTPLDLRVTVSALALPPPPNLKTQTVPYFNATVFDFAATTYADGIYRNANFTERPDDSASAELNVSKNGAVETEVTLTLAGEYEITVLAESPDFVGTATLAAILTAHWRLEYEVDSGPGNLVARDADGNVLPSGGAIAPGAIATLTAEPSGTHYVSAWRGDCENLGTVGVAEKPGAAQTCKLTAGKILEVGAVFLPGLPPESFGVLEPERSATVYVAPNYAGSVAFFAAATTGVTLQTPPTAPESFGFPLDSDFESPEGFVVSLTLAAGSENVTVAAIDATMKFRDYAEAEIPLRVEIRALAAPALSVFTGVEGGDEVATGATVAAFSLADYPDAAFYEVEDSSNLFEISANGEVVISVAGGLPAGTYDFAAEATSAMFLGAVEFQLQVAALGGSDAAFILPDRREILRPTVPGYVGSVAFLRRRPRARPCGLRPTRPKVLIFRPAGISSRPTASP